MNVCVKMKDGGLVVCSAGEAVPPASAGRGTGGPIPTLALPRRGGVAPGGDGVPAVLPSAANRLPAAGVARLRPARCRPPPPFPRPRPQPRPRSRRRRGWRRLREDQCCSGPTFRARTHQEVY